jgi:hypothetical protein
MGQLGIFFFCEVVALAEVETVTDILNSDTVLMGILIFLKGQGSLQLQLSILFQSNISSTGTNSEQVIDELIDLLVAVEEEERKRPEGDSYLFESDEFNLSRFGSVARRDYLSRTLAFGGLFLEKASLVVLTIFFIVSCQGVYLILECSLLFRVL